MVISFLRSAFHPKEEDHNELGAVRSRITCPSSTPSRRSPSRMNAFCKTHNKHDNKNPYSTWGLDKFEALRADLEEKKKKIYAQNDPENISMVRFVYKNSNECVPIVVKHKDNLGQSKSPPRAKEVSDKVKSPRQSTIAKIANSTEKFETDKKFTDKKSWDNWKRPSYYMPAAIILILVLLVFFGRSAAILCTSIGWYVVPTLSGDRTLAGNKKSIDADKIKKKKELATRMLSENEILIAQGSPDRSPTHLGHRRSW